MCQGTPGKRTVPTTTPPQSPLLPSSLHSSAPSLYTFVFCCCALRLIKHGDRGNKEFLQLCKICESQMLYLSIRYYYYAINSSANSDRDSVFKSYARVSVWTPQWWQVEKVNPIKLYEEIGRASCRERV